MSLPLALRGDKSYSLLQGATYGGATPLAHGVGACALGTEGALVLSLLMRLMLGVFHEARSPLDELVWDWASPPRWIKD